MKSMFNTRIATLFIAVLVVVSSAGGAAAAAATIDDPNNVNYDADATQNPRIEATVDKEVHQVGWSATEYESDSGEVATLEGHVNESSANPVTVTATDIEFQDAGAFPHDSNESALNSSHWTAGGTNSSKISASDTTTAPNVDALNVATDGSMASGDSAKVTYTLPSSIDSDENKRSLQVFVDVATLDSSAHTEIRVVDADGDYKRAIVDADNSTDSKDVLANSTGEGFVLQHQMGDLETHTVSGSDGTFDDITKVEVVTTDGDSELSMSVLNAEKLGQYTLGEQKYDSDDDGEKDETRKITEPTGAYSITGFDTLGSTFDSATVHGASIDMIFAAEDLEKETDARIEFTEDGEDGSYPSFEWVVDTYYRLSLPSAYDLSYSNAEMTDEVKLPSSRYQTVEYAEGVSDTEFSEISSWSSVKSSYGSQGNSVSIDSTIQPGQEIAIHYEYVVTDGEKTSMEDTGGSAGQFAKDNGGFFSGIWNFITSLPGIGAIAGVVGSIVGGKWAMGK